MIEVGPLKILKEIFESHLMLAHPGNCCGSANNIAYYININHRWIDKVTNKIYFKIYKSIFKIHRLLYTNENDAPGITPNFSRGRSE